ncbi:hypothetical protein EJB05_41105, partial [Eragrostis curvula]
MAGYTPLRRWRQFFPAFEAIHSAIEASYPAVVAKDDLGWARELQGFTAEVAQFLRGSAWNDPAEDLCVALDEIMVEYLVTLKTVPVTTSMLASTGLANAVGVLYEHQSEKIRGLAREIVGGWRESVVKEEFRRDRTAMEGQDLKAVVVSVAAVDGEKKTQVEKETKTASVVRSSRVEPAKIDAPAKVAASLPKKNAPLIHAIAVVGNGHGDHASGGSDKMEATKRKLQEGYKEAADAKRQRRIQVIKAPKTKTLEQGQRKTHPIFKERSRARGVAGSTAARRSLMPAFQRV